MFSSSIDGSEDFALPGEDGFCIALEIYSYPFGLLLIIVQIAPKDACNIAAPALAQTHHVDKDTARGIYCFKPVLVLGQAELTDKENLKSYLYSRINSPARMYYVILDEVQQVDGFERIVNGLNARDHVDVYVTGSNSKMLSKDINTIFRGRGDEVRVSPFSFKEFCTDRSEPLSELWKEYYTYGGMPALLHHRTPAQKVAYLQRLWSKTYLSDVVERNHIRNKVALDALTDSLCSAIGSLSNPNKIKNALQSIQNVKIDVSTVGSYIDHLSDAYLFEGARP